MLVILLMISWKYTPNNIDLFEIRKKKIENYFAINVIAFVLLVFPPMYKSDLNAHIIHFWLAWLHRNMLW